MGHPPGGLTSLVAGAAPREVRPPATPERYRGRPWACPYPIPRPHTAGVPFFDTSSSISSRWAPSMTGPFPLPRPSARRPVVAHRSAAAPISTGVPSRGTRGRAFWGARDPSDRVGCPFRAAHPSIRQCGAAFGHRSFPSAWFSSCQPFPAILVWKQALERLLPRLPSRVKSF